MIIFKKANKEEFKYCYDIRVKVFVDEQGWGIDEELDDLDSSCIHYLAKDDDKYIGTLRVYIKNGDGHVGRVCILKEYRGHYIGFNLMKYMEEDLKSEVKTLSLGAQSYAEDFYKKLGFESYGEHFTEGKIDHVNMIKKL